MEEHYLGHTIKYWIELNKRTKELNLENLLEEVVKLRGQLEFTKDRLAQITSILK